MGIWGGCGEALIKRGHVVGLGYFLVLIPSKECGAIGCAINLGRWAVPAIQRAVLLTARAGRVF